MYPPVSLEACLTLVVKAHALCGLAYPLVVSSLVSLVCMLSQSEAEQVSSHQQYVVAFVAVVAFAPARLEIC